MLREIAESRVVNIAILKRLQVIWQKKRARKDSQIDGGKKDFLALMELQVADGQRWGR